MSSADLRAARKARGWRKKELARRLGVSQPLVSLWEKGQRTVPPHHWAQLRRLGVQLDPTTLPTQKFSASKGVDLARELANLGYPGFAHHQLGEAAWNPAQLLVLALAQNQLDRRVAEALPWLAFRYWNMNWEWVFREAKVRDLQNRLGFTLLLAWELAEKLQCREAANRLRQAEQDLRHSLLAKEDTYCNERMTESERHWLREHRSPEAAAWRLLSDLRPEHLSHAA
jgi:transcriptional regulator with XRE-family HTH domain